MELVYVYAMTNHLHDIEDFLSIMNIVDVLEVGEKCLSAWVRTKLQLRVLGKLEIPSELLHVLSQS